MKINNEEKIQRGVVPSLAKYQLNYRYNFSRSVPVPRSLLLSSHSLLPVHNRAKASRFKYKFQSVLTISFITLHLTICKSYLNLIGSRQKKNQACIFYLQNFFYSPSPPRLLNFFLPCFEECKIHNKKQFKVINHVLRPIYCIFTYKEAKGIKN